jgi:hypothetical protein
MKYWKDRHLTAELERSRSEREVKAAPAQVIKHWLKQNISDTKIRKWYIQEVAKDFLIERK